MAVGISAIQPFAYIFVIALNDMFGILDSLQLFLLAGFISVFAVVSNWRGERNLKTTITLFLLTFAYIVSIHSFNGFAGSHITAIQNVIDSLTDMFSAINNPADLLGIIAVTLPTFFVNLIILLISLPALLIDLLLFSIGIISPALASAMSIFEAPLIAGAYVYLILKGYEVGRNMFKSV